MRQVTALRRKTPELEPLALEAVAEGTNYDVREVLAKARASRRALEAPKNRVGFVEIGRFQAEEVQLHAHARCQQLACATKQACRTHDYTGLAHAEAAGGTWPDLPTMRTHHAPVENCRPGLAKRPRRLTTHCAGRNCRGTGLGCLECTRQSACKQRFGLSLTLHNALGMACVPSATVLQSGAHGGCRTTARSSALSPLPPLMPRPRLGAGEPPDER